MHKKYLLVAIHIKMKEKMIQIKIPDCAKISAGNQVKSV